MSAAAIFMSLMSLIGGISPGAPPQTPQERIKVQTSLVNVPVMVSDPRGNSVLGLKKDDFRVYDNGVLQPLSFFVAADEPHRVALLLDTSKSTEAVLKQIKRAATSFVAELRPQDQAMVMTFDLETHVVCRFGASRDTLKRAINRVEVAADDGTRLRDALATALRRYLGAGEGRKAVILLTDGEDTGSTEAPDSVIQLARNSGVVVYPLFYAIPPSEMSKKLFGVSLPKGLASDTEWKAEEGIAAAWLKHVAEESAGVFYRSDLADLKKVFGKVANELRCQYLLAFYPNPVSVDSSEHSLRIELSRTDLNVRARRSYQVMSR